MPRNTQPLTQELALDFWRRLENQGYIDFANIVFYSYRSLAEDRGLADGLSRHFAWLLVDEFQDTSALQTEILTLIAEGGRTKFFLVGDPFQSIFGFAGAQPELMTRFGDRIHARTDFSLTGNWRSSRPIIRHAERLIPRTPPMVATGDASAFNEEPEHHDAATIFEAITDYFLPALDGLHIPYGRAAVLAPSWFPLWSLGRRLREGGVPIVGPGASPYKRSRLFASLAEHICAYVERPAGDRIPEIEKELFILLSRALESPQLRIFSYAGRVTVCALIRAGETLRSRFDSGIGWLYAAAEAFSEILHQHELLPRSEAHLLTESVNEMHQDMLRNRVDVANLTVADLGMFASPEDNLKLLTMHRAKGREFDAVALVDLHDGRIPHFAARSEAERDESKRLFYVAITRARRILMYVTDHSNWRNRASPYLGTVLGR